jgi:hypothetical protein
MGYRSEVKIIAGKNAAAELLKVNKKHELFIVTPGEHDETLFEADWLKWYEEEEDVAEYVAVIDKYIGKSSADPADGDPADGIDFYRIGEDSSDVDHQSTYSTYATLDLAIVANGFVPKPKPTKKSTKKK